MKRMALFPLLTLALTAQTPATPKPEAPKPAAPAPKPQPKPEAPKEDKVVAVIGTEVIRQSDVDAALAAMPQQQQMQVQMSTNGRQMFTQQYVDSRLLSAMSKKQGLDKAESFQKRLAQAEQQLLASELINRDSAMLQKRLEMKDEELQTYFTEHKAKYAQPDKYTARHILVSIKPKTDKEPGVTEEEAKVKVQKIQEELKKGRPFEELVKEYSDDPGSKNTGGKYEDFDAGRMVPEFANAVRTQEIGKVGEPVKTQFGFHLVEVLKKTPAEEPKFEAVKEQVRQTLLAERRESVWKNYLDGIRKEIPCVMGDAAGALAKQMGAAAPKTAPKPAAKGGKK